MLSTRHVGCAPIPARSRRRAGSPGDDCALCGSGLFRDVVQRVPRLLPQVDQDSGGGAKGAVRVCGVRREQGLGHRHGRGGLLCPPPRCCGSREKSCWKLGVMVLPARQSTFIGGSNTTPQGSASHTVPHMPYQPTALSRPNPDPHPNPSPNPNTTSLSAAHALFGLAALGSFAWTSRARGVSREGPVSRVAQRGVYVRPRRVYERRPRKAHPVCTFCRPSCVQRTRSTNESEVSSPSNTRISAYVRVVVLGVLRRAVFWA